MGRFGQAFLLATFAACGYGSSGIFIHFFSSQGITPSGMLMGRYWIIALLLGPVAIQSRHTLAWSSVRKLLLLGMLVITIQVACYIVAVQDLGPGTAAILIYVYPSLVLLWERILFQRPIRSQQVGLIALSWVGSYLVVGTQTIHGTWIGAVAALLSAVLYSFYLSISHHVSRGCTIWITSWAVAVGAAIGSSLLACFWAPHFPAPTISLFSMMVGLALFATLFPMVAIFASMQRIGAAATSLLCMSEPIFAVLVGVWLFQESLGPVQIAGAVLIMIASALLSQQKPAQPLPHSI